MNQIVGYAIVAITLGGWDQVFVSNSENRQTKPLSASINSFRKNNTVYLLKHQPLKYLRIVNIASKDARCARDGVKHHNSTRKKSNWKLT